MGKRGRKEAGVAELVPRVLWEELSKLRPHLAQWLPENTPGEHLLGLPPPLWACRQPRCPHSPLTATPPLCPGVRGSNPITKGVKASPERTPPPPPQEPWRGLCAPCNAQSPSAHLVRVPRGAGGSWAAWWVPPQWSESGCVAWVLFSIRWGTRSRFQFQPFYYSDDMCLLSNSWIQKPNCRQVT